MNREFESEVKVWDIFELSIEGPKEGNPFIEQNVKGIFSHKNESVVIEGFYDGEGLYRIRFMPRYEGKYTFILKGSFIEEPISGVFYAKEKDEKNHGVVRVQHGTEFAYEDGTQFIPLGTTAYVWHLQDDDTIENTIETLENSPFNKVRFCVFPKHYLYNFNEPRLYPFVGKPMDSSQINEDNYMQYFNDHAQNDFDFTRINPEYFQHLDRCVSALLERGIEAELILFHPYDRWGFSTLTEKDAENYLRYMINRYSSFHNVWWSLANEYDLMKYDTKTWEKFGRYLMAKDPYQHLRSIHHCKANYDYSRSWITHCSIQRTNLYVGVEETNEYIDRYHKPVVYDEMGYEGNIAYGWGNISAEEEVRRAYEVALRGGYPTHGETVLNDTNHLWWAHGGKLYGESTARLAYLKDVLYSDNNKPLHYEETTFDELCSVRCEDDFLNAKNEYYYYYGFMRPSYRYYHIDEDTEYVVEIIDTWNMKKKKVGIYKGKFKVELPAQPYILVHLRKPIEEDYLNPIEDWEEEEALTIEEEVAPVITEEVVNEVVEEEEVNEQEEITLVLPHEEESVYVEDKLESASEETSQIEEDAEIENDEFLNDEAETEIEENTSEEVESVLRERNIDDLFKRIEMDNTD
ncbi:MAG: DUF4038 domain-containing protein, partial [Solobacterium sp.]|nr:DUF4038 domain-containing protein [Solobacterium sp.]